MKTCAKCQEEKPTSAFSRNGCTSDGLQERCRTCCNAYAKARNREAISAQRRARNAADPRPNRARVRAWNAANRTAAVAIYGGRCVQCGSTDRLEFDHVNTDGSEHRAVEISTVMCARIARCGRRIQDWQLQLLCHSCHRAKTDGERKRSTMDRDAEIVRRRQTGETMRVIAEAVGVSSGTVYRIVKLHAVNGGLQ
jgi:5-methylcytosine-specific restriction endonuclease McrA